MNPSETYVSPEMIWSNVVLPLPVGPVTHHCCPCFQVNDIGFCKTRSPLFINKSCAIMILFDIALFLLESFGTKTMRKHRQKSLLSYRLRTGFVSFKNLFWKSKIVITPIVIAESAILNIY